MTDSVLPGTGQAGMATERPPPDAAAPREELSPGEISPGELSPSDNAPGGIDASDSQSSGNSPTPVDRRQMLRDWVQRVGLVRKAAYALTLLAIASGVGSYTTFANAGPAGPDPQVVLGLLYLNLSLLLVLVALVAHRLVNLWSQRRQGLAGSQLHGRLVMLFSVVAVTPTIVVAVFSVLLFDFGIRSWFSERIGTAVRGSQAVAEAYLEEHRRNILGDALAMASDLNRDSAILLSRPQRLGQVLRAQAAIRNLSEVVVFEGAGKVLARAGLSLTFDFEPFPEDAFRRARAGEVATLTSDVDRIRAIVRLEGFVDAYLYLGRYVEPEILAYIDRTKQAVAQYRELEGRRIDIQITFALIFAVVSLLLLFAAIWVGLNLATRLAGPVSDLIGAAEKVSAGDLSARVGEGELSELGTLSRAFNRMTRQLAAQRNDLIDAHRQEDTRRRFTEAVLGGVSAGVIGLDASGRINLPNRSAAHLLDIALADLADCRLEDIVPELSALLDQARKRPSRRAEGQVELSRGDRRITLLCRISAEMSDGEITGFVVTFDDISELQSAQRKAAWSDVARRIAHEIKNPLTPIQLSAERLKRKYLGQITKDADTFEALTETIVRQVEDIGRMVDAFSEFARMPAAVFQEANLATLLREQTALQDTAHPEIHFELTLPDRDIPLLCDARQVRQALTNLLQNAADSIESRAQQDDPAPGAIEISVTADQHHALIMICDNGRGLPVVDRHRLTEPYVTTRDKGTGLGLAIVRKIMEDHDGEIRILDRDGGGAMAILEFPMITERITAETDREAGTTVDIANDPSQGKAGTHGE
ncbi:MAG: PAS domain-containing sensor histidine kinase [Proteobacteria bacterium]|nr:PAS domain-containing sensor histidine kinase [Pseudomonadota bacterium]